MKIAILAYDRMTALDAIGPNEVLCRMYGTAIFPNDVMQYDRQSRAQEIEVGNSVV